ncbi:MULTISPECIES: TfoX/Sxy family protein [unclassified Tenacibaculum]|uniref:TfoX/Sxy family protein n=1 Tax=unclassified Tenacibaculum TaxID=2635139 RepID=UPI001F345FF0|nr:MULTISPECIES: TfoX/Sxy family protein [unclassified Tenacibaculum]MCF2873327.1 TfoX/Sxy family protein [Tenacibaculum sp. Cn5-1]MCF2933483.1 TfoX/Sxy family protein [Tenacibaculum sp. Cn5-34]MCG7509935.1 TfoX/Sxy family protein [Tenacibaculum sp. Cn5-46]
MAYNEFLTDRISQFFNEKHVSFYEKKMFGSLCFMVNDKMCVIVNKNELMARIHPDIYEEALTKEGCEDMSFSGKRKPVKGYVILTEEAFDLDEDLHYWLQLALDYNPFAKASKKKTSK